MTNLYVGVVGFLVVVVGIAFPFQLAILASLAASLRVATTRLIEKPHREDRSKVSFRVGLPTILCYFA